MLRANNFDTEHLDTRETNHGQEIVIARGRTQRARPAGADKAAIEIGHPVGLCLRNGPATRKRDDSPVSKEEGNPHGPMAIGRFIT